MSAWRSEIASEILEAQLKALFRRSNLTEEMINVQSRLRVSDPSSFAYRLSLSSLQNRQQSLQREIAAVLHLRRQETIKLALEGERFQDHSAYIGDLSVVLSSAQKIFTSIVQATTTGPTQRGPVPTAIEQLARLRLTNTYSSSFGMQLEADTSVDMFGNSEVLTALDTFFALLGSGDNREQLIDRAGNLGPRVLNHYKRFVKQLANSGTSISLSWQDPVGDIYRWEAREIELVKLNQSLTSITTELNHILQVEGWLLGASLLRNRFEFVPVDGEPTISGRISKDAKNDVASLFGQRCMAEIAETIMSDEATESQKSVFTLIAIHISADQIEAA